MMTLGQRLTDVGGRPTGFDYLRIGLASMVIVVHSVLICQGSAVDDRVWSTPGLHAVSMVVLPMFFSLSGFLVAGSLDRSPSILMFLGLRTIRIYPALAVEVLLCAFLLGPCLTNEPLLAYFSDHLFYRYLLNVTGDISYHLPGVFTHNELHVVNGQLWTIPYELACYATISAAFLLRIVRQPLMLLLGVLALQATFIDRAYSTTNHWQHMPFYGHVMGNQFIVSFLVGILFYQFRDRLPWNTPLGIMMAIASALLYSHAPGEYVGLFSVAYATIYLGLLNPRKVCLLRGADYSYGVYLYGFPIQQALVTTAPLGNDPLVNSVLTLIIATAFAALSWHIIEKPALKLRRPLEKATAKWIKVRDKLAGSFFACKWKAERNTGRSIGGKDDERSGVVGALRLGRGSSRRGH